MNERIEYTKLNERVLTNLLLESRKKYLALRFQKNANELENASYIMKQARRTIARILTEFSMRKIKSQKYSNKKEN